MTFFRDFSGTSAAGASVTVEETAGMGSMLGMPVP